MILAPLQHALVLAFLAMPPQASPPEPHSLAEIRLNDPATVLAARHVGIALDCQARLPGNRAEIVVTDSQLAEMRRKRHPAFGIALRFRWGRRFIR